MSSCLQDLGFRTSIGATAAPPAAPPPPFVSPPERNSMAIIARSSQNSKDGCEHSTRGGPDLKGRRLSHRSSQNSKDGCEHSTRGGPDLKGRRFHNTEAVEMPVHEWLQMGQAGFHRDEIASSYQYGRDASVCCECSWEAMIIRWKKCAKFYGVMTSDFIYMTQ
jgi:hypothetical protein